MLELARYPTLWNSWRASLLRQLYTETKRAMRRGLENPVDREEQIRQTQSAALDILVRGGTDPDDVEQLWAQLGDDYFPVSYTHLTLPTTPYV